MAYRGLQDFMAALEAEGELVRIREFVDPRLEVAEIVDRVSKVGGPALLFENTGTAFPLVINLFGTERRMSRALGVERLDDIGREIEALLKLAPAASVLDKLKMLPKLGQMASVFPKVVRGPAPCQEVVLTGDAVDLYRLPILTCWPEDGGPFVTLTVINTKDPDTGIRNVGMYRMQVYDRRTTGMHWHMHKVSAAHFRKWRARGERMPVAVVLGSDPAVVYSATAPLPPNIDEYLLAGFLRKKKVELVKCRTVDLEVPADAEIVLEGYVEPDEDFRLEGPFGDHTGYYSLPDYYPTFHVTAVTHRRDAVYPTTIVGTPPQEDAWIGKATERIFLAPIKMTMLPEVTDMVLPVEGVFHNLVVVQIRKEFPGHAHKVMHALWGAGQMMFTKMMVIVDEGVDLHDTDALVRYVAENMDPLRDAVFTEGPMDVLDHACTSFAFGGKVGLDATRKLPEELGPSGRSAAEALRTDRAPLSLEEARALVPEVTGIHFPISGLRPALGFVSLEKDVARHGTDQVARAVRALFAHPAMAATRLLVVLDAEVNVADAGEAVWRFSNNIDPKRDAVRVEPAAPGATGRLGFDATRKVAAEGFNRPWPNIIIADDRTIRRVDELWPRLGLGPLVPSPSLRHLAKVHPGGAFVDEAELPRRTAQGVPVG